MHFCTGSWRNADRNWAGEENGKKNEKEEREIGIEI